MHFTSSAVLVFAVARGLVNAAPLDTSPLPLHLRQADDWDGQRPRPGLECDAQIQPKFSDCKSHPHTRSA